MKINFLIISQPVNNSPYSEIISKHKVSIDFQPFLGKTLNTKEFHTKK